jgi:tetratricopeptide (TPR) repeat protein
MSTADAATSLDAAGLDAARSEAARTAADCEASKDWRGLAVARRRQGEIAQAAGSLDDAEKHLRAALSLYVMLDDGYSAALVLVSLARIQLAIGDYVAAVDLSRQAAERVPGDTEALTILANAEWAAGSPADAEVTFSQVLRWDADAAPALAGRGEVRADRGSYALALDDLDRALKLGLERAAEADARSARALALAGLGRSAKARTELAESLRLTPGSARVLRRARRIEALTASSAGSTVSVDVTSPEEARS